MWNIGATGHGIAPHPHIDVTVGHHPVRFGYVKIFSCRCAGPEELLAGRGLWSVQLGPRDHAWYAPWCSGRAVVDVIECQLCSTPPELLTAERSNPPAPGPVSSSEPSCVRDMASFYLVRTVIRRERLRCLHG